MVIRYSLSSSCTSASSLFARPTLLLVVLFPHCKWHWCILEMDGAVLVVYLQSVDVQERPTLAERAPRWDLHPGSLKLLGHHAGHFAFSDFSTCSSWSFSWSSSGSWFLTFLCYCKGIKAKITPLVMCILQCCTCLANSYSYFKC